MSGEGIKNQSPRCGALNYGDCPKNVQGGPRMLSCQFRIHQTMSTASSEEDDIIEVISDKNIMNAFSKKNIDIESTESTESTEIIIDNNYNLIQIMEDYYYEHKINKKIIKINIENKNIIKTDIVYNNIQTLKTDIGITDDQIEYLIKQDTLEELLEDDF